MHRHTVYSAVVLGALLALSVTAPAVAMAQARAVPQRAAPQPAVPQRSQARLGAEPAQRAIDMFIKIDGIDGEATDRDHRGWIEIDSWSFGTARSSERRASPSGQGPGYATVVLHGDKASPKLSEACANGRSLGRIVLHVRAAGSTDAYEEYVLDETSVSCNQSSSEDRPTENITLNFGKIEPSAPDGDPDRPVVTGR